MGRQRIDEGISEDEAWRLFRQVLEALMHMASLNIVQFILFNWSSPL
jgi:translation initiation factor 2-alpha kinase 4